MNYMFWQSQNIHSGYAHRVAQNVFLFTVSMVILFLCGCSTKKNTAVSRQWQAFNTRYNVYFNGREHLEEQLAEMERNYADDYSRFLPMHPAEARYDELLPQPSGDFKRTIEKMQKAIQLHSIKKKPIGRAVTQKEKNFKARDEFNPFLHNVWMTLALARYLDGDFLGAASTYAYVSRHFSWLPETVSEARLMQALCYCALHWNYEAENVLHLVKEKDLTTKKLNALYNYVTADRLILNKEYAEAAPYLEKAAEASSGVRKHRLYYLLGQIRAAAGNRAAAFEAFGKAGSGMTTPHKLKFNALVKQTEVLESENVSSRIRKLQRMTRYERNHDELDQIYYAIGNLYMAEKDTADAIGSFSTAIERSAQQGIYKAQAEVSLADIYFARGRYFLAQPLYAAALPQLPSDYPGYTTLRLRNEVLYQLAVFQNNVELQDSLLRLSELPQNMREVVCKELASRYVKEQKENESITSHLHTSTSSQPHNSIPSTTPSWYFYNPALVAAGKTEFQRQWGIRRPEDNWRRLDKSSFMDAASEDAESDYVSEPPDSLFLHNSKSPHLPSTTNLSPDTPEFYLSQIPATQAEVENSRGIIADGLYNMGIILKDRLEDYSAAKKMFDELLYRFPDSKFRLDALYNLYLMAARTGNDVDAGKWRMAVISDFPESSYALALGDPHYLDKLRNMGKVTAALWDKAYNAYLDNNNVEVHSLFSTMVKEYPLSPLMPKFYFIDALAYATEGDTQMFKNRLSTLLERWPETDMTDVASGMMRNLSRGLTPMQGEENTRFSSIWNIPLSENTGDEETATPFEVDPDDPQYLVLAFSLDSINPNQVLFDVARFNFSTFTVKDFDLEKMTLSDIGLVIVKGFDNLRQVERYRTIMERNGFTLPEGVRPIMISRHNFELLIREGRSFEDYFRFEESSHEIPPD